MPSSLPTLTEGLNPKLGRIRIYPFKSLPGYEVASSGFNQNGGLINDRRYAFALPSGKFFNAKSDARLHQIRLRFCREAQSYRFSLPCAQESLEWQTADSFQKLEDWIKKHFNVTIVIQESVEQGFPDDLVAPGPTIISTETIRTIASWYPDISEERIRRRLRTNLEIENVPAFWEDQLFGEKDKSGVPFKIGNAQLIGTNPCQRCVVPSRDSDNGELTRGFSRTFSENRQATLPQWAARSAFDHYFRVATNTRIPFQGTLPRISVGEMIHFDPRIQ